LANEEVNTLADRTAPTPRDATYIIEGKPVTLVNGYSEVELAPPSASKTVTKYFGNEARGDLNGDGLEDFIVGGSSFYNATIFNDSCF